MFFHRQWIVNLFGPHDAQHRLPAHRTLSTISAPRRDLTGRFHSKPTAYPERDNPTSREVSVEKTPQQPSNGRSATLDIENPLACKTGRRASRRFVFHPQPLRPPNHSSSSHSLALVTHSPRSEATALIPFPRCRMTPLISELFAAGATDSPDATRSKARRWNSGGFASDTSDRPILEIVAFNLGSFRTRPSPHNFAVRDRSYSHSAPLIGFCAGSD